MTTHRLAQAAYRPEQDFLPPPVSLTVTPAAPGPGEAVTLTATLKNTTGITLRGTVLYLAVGDNEESDGLGGIAPGRSVTRTWKTRLPDDAEEWSPASRTRSSTCTRTDPTAPARPRR